MLQNVCFSEFDEIMAFTFDFGKGLFLDIRFTIMDTIRNLIIFHRF